MIVKTYKGKNLEKSKCRKIQNDYYEIGDNNIEGSGGCYKVNGRYHRFNNGLIEFDHENKSYVLVNKQLLTRGIVSINKDDSFILGFFSPNPTKNIKVVVDNFNVTNCIDEETLGSKYSEHLNTGNFYKKDEMSKSSFNKIGKAPVDKNSLNYDSRFVTKMIEKSYNQYYKVPSVKNQMVEELGILLEKNKITFGLEFETSKGYLPDRLCYKHGIVALRDGSISGLEYVTVPLDGRKGLYNVMEICKLLKKRTDYDFTCALHLHLGGLKRDVDNILSINNIANMLEEDMYSLQPLSKKISTDYGKNKNYSGPMNCTPLSIMMSDTDKPLPKLKKLAFDSLFKHLSGGYSFSDFGNDLEKIQNHPKDPNGTSKWNIRSRYVWFNMIPIIFTNKQTVEFRQHNNTFDFFKIYNFMLSSAIMVMAANKLEDKFNNPKFLKSFSKLNSKYETLVKLTKSEFPELTDSLCENNIKYFKERVKVMKKMNINDPKGLNEHKFYDDFTNTVDE